MSHVKFHVSHVKYSFFLPHGGLKVCAGIASDFSKLGNYTNFYAFYDFSNDSAYPTNSQELLFL